MMPATIQPPTGRQPAPLPAARARAVTKIYGRGPAAVTALDAVSLDIPAGSFIAVIPQQPKATHRTRIDITIGTPPLDPSPAGSTTTGPSPGPPRPPGPPPAGNGSPRSDTGRAQSGTGETRQWQHRAHTPRIQFWVGTQEPPSGPGNPVASLATMDPFRPRDTRGRPWLRPRAGRQAPGL
jgi:hypothetical protein